MEPHIHLAVEVNGRTHTSILRLHVVRFPLFATGHITYADLLLTEDPDGFSTQTSFSHPRPAWYAVRYGTSWCLQWLVEHGADTTTPDLNGNTPGQLVYLNNRNDQPEMEWLEAAIKGELTDKKNQQAQEYKLKKWRFEGLDDKAEDWLDKNKAKQRKYKTGDFADPYPLPPPEELWAKMDLPRSTIPRPPAKSKPPLPVAMLFPGQGSQYKGMLQNCLEIPAVEKMLEQADKILGWSVKQLCLEGPEERLAETKYCQPIMFIAGVAGVELMKQTKREMVDRVQAVAGLSLGEYTALCAAGVLEFEDGLQLVKLRAEAMQKATDLVPQAMCSVAGLDRNTVDRLCREAKDLDKTSSTPVCQVANVLFPAGFTCGGTKIAIDKLCELATKELTKAIDATLPKMKPPRCAVYFNLTGKKMPPGSKPSDFVEYMKKQLTGEVLWEQTVRQMVFDGVKDFYEVGPLKQLKSMIKRPARSREPHLRPGRVFVRFRCVTDQIDQDAFKRTENIPVEALRKRAAQSQGLTTARLVATASAALAAARKNRSGRESPRALRRSFSWLFGKGGEDAARWWRHHPRAGDLLIGWVMHPTLTQGNKLDLEVDFASSTGGLWRSRALNFQGKFHSKVEDAKLILQDDVTKLEGRMEHESLGIEGYVIHERESGGKFILRPLPECYREWWSQVKGKLRPEERPDLIVIGEEGFTETPEDTTEYPDFSSPEQLRKFLMRRISQQMNGQRRSSGGTNKESKREEILGKFSFRPDEVKTYLDRYVICQDAAKEMLAVAICDHYNRAKEELHFPVGPREAEGEDVKPEEASQGPSTAETTESTSTEEATSPTDHPKKAAKRAEEAPEQGGSCPEITEKAESVCFTDTDGDVILLQLEGDQLVEYVNGELEIEHVKQFDINLEERTYSDQDGSGNFKEDADVIELKRSIDRMLARAAKASLLKPKRVKNFTKPNILLLGPTGSGKTYLLRNLADLIGVPFVKADATKFTETGYVGRDADEVMGELLQAADGDVELAQVGIVYVDEIDKVCSEGERGSSSFRRATQSTFLKLMEDTEVTVASPNRMMLGALEKGVKMSTRHVLFVFSGAFSQLDEKLKEEYKKDMKGFGFTNSGSDQLEEVQSMLHKADTDELVKAGMEREFVGRLPVRVALQALSQDDLFQVLTKAEDGATAQLTDDFRRYGIELRFSEPALRAVAAKAAKEGTGARALVWELSLKREELDIGTRKCWGRWEDIVLAS
ncbi:unnamed protein product [Durusdinium trenchii]|uniref:Uncharacterized protein n=1 Tax=Durusdinium trenchii TaxID=1381693 RepID=A0ABP0Q9D7_9DINO